MRILVVLTLFLGATQQARAQVTVEQTQAMSFGTITAAPQGDTIRLRQNGNVSSNNGSDLQGTTNAAIFLVEGPRNETISYSFGANNTLSNGSETISLQNFETNRSNPFNLPGNGRRTINIGANLIIPSGLNGGAFSGTFLMIFDNQ